MQKWEYPFEEEYSMEPIPNDLLAQFDAVLVQKVVPSKSHDDYRKWLRYFLDYRLKYPPPDQRSEQVRLFIEKLRSKGEAGRDLHDAAHALSLYFSLLPKNAAAVVHTAVFREAPRDAELEMPVSTAVQPTPSAPVGGPAKRGGRRYNEWWSSKRQGRLNGTRS